MEQTITDREIDLFLSCGEDVFSLTIPALVTGQLAVHEEVTASFWEKEAEHWQVTQVESGCIAFTFYSKDAALECAIALEQLDWSADMTDQNWLNKCFSIFNQFAAKYGSPIAVEGETNG